MEHARLITLLLLGVDVRAGVHAQALRKQTAKMKTFAEVLAAVLDINPAEYTEPEIVLVRFTTGLHLKQVDTARQTCTNLSLQAHHIALVRNASRRTCQGQQYS